MQKPTGGCSYNYCSIKHCIPCFFSVVQPHKWNEKGEVPNMEDGCTHLYLVVPADLQCKQEHFMQLNWNTEFSRKVQTYSKPHAYSLEHWVTISTYTLSFLYVFLSLGSSFWMNRAWGKDSEIVLSCFLWWSPHFCYRHEYLPTCKLPEKAKVE